MRLGRRGFLKAGAVALGGVAGMAFSDFGSAEEVRLSGERRFKLRVFVHDDERGLAPATAKQAESLYAMELNYDPIHRDVKYVQDGEFTLALPDAPFALAVLTTVEGFGHVWLFADNDGKGYPTDGSIGKLFLNLEFASSRLSAVRGYMAKGKAEGCLFSAEARAEMEDADGLLRKAKSTEARYPAQAARLAMESLCKTMWAGERVAFELAKHRTANAGLRSDFLFGCNAFRYADPESEYAKHYRELFDYATLGFYWGGFEPERDKPAWAKLDRQADLLRSAGITAKGHPLIWLFEPSGFPKWLETRDFDTFHRLSRQRINDIVTHYKGKIDKWDVINEAHDWANTPGYDHKQLTELTRMACDETKKANPNAVRVVNNTLMWGDYSVAPGQTKRTKWTPREYVAEMITAGVDFEVIGLQMYYFNNDLFEVDRLFDRFAKFGKPVHITEIGVSSAPTEDPTAHGKMPHGLWHAPWSEKVQADYIEQFHTIAHSKPHIRAITYWDFSDEGGHFWAHGGFLGPGDKPKESYHRLKKLIAGWRER